MPGSATTPGRPGTRAHAPVRIAFHLRNSVGTRDMNLCEAQWLAYVLPCRRFAATLAGDSARLGAGADRYSFTVVDLHLLLLAGFTGAPKFLTYARSIALPWESGVSTVSVKKRFYVRRRRTSQPSPKSAVPNSTIVLDSGTTVTTDDANAKLALSMPM